MTSKPVYTSKAEGFRLEAEIEALRPIPTPKPRKPRSASALREVTSGIVCFCGERFWEGEGENFLRHLRDEVGEDLAMVQRLKARYKRHNDKRDPVQRREQQRERYASDTEYRDYRRRKASETYQRMMADPVLHEEYLRKKRIVDSARRARNKGI